MAIGNLLIMKRLFFPFRLPVTPSLLTAMSFRNKGHLLYVMLCKLNIAISGKTRTSTCRGTFVILQRLLEIKHKQGLKGLTSYLKTCSVSTQQALGGHVHPNLTDLNTRVSRTAKGIPKVLPVLWRSSIFTQPLLARYILTIFAVYRFFLFESPVKVKAITGPFTGNQEFLDGLRKYIPAFFLALSRANAYPKWERPEQLSGIFPILTQSPTSKGLGVWSSKKVSVIRAWLVLTTNPAYSATWESLKVISAHFNVPLFSEIFHSIARHLGKHDAEYLKSVSFLGKLGLKQEAAGKMRVFAMVDPLTQWVLYPIHRFIFDCILDKLPMDGTFNQLLPLERSRSWSELYSLDLSSATDRLPVSLQSQIINYIWPGLGEHWRISLVERPYYNPDSKEGIKYAVGQPMGAYSSWAMLALTHHFIIQVSAWMACVTPQGNLFLDYAVLGDDVVIGNKAVKDKYLYLLSQIGVECGLHKSLLSPTGTALEFAKRTWHLGRDVSPLTIKDLAASLMSVQGLVSFMNHHQVSLPNALKIAGFGYRVLGGLNKPFFKLNEIVRNTILCTIFPSEIETASELFGRHSLTRYTWEPLIGDPQVLMLIRGMMSDTLNNLFRYMAKPNPLIEKDVSIFTIKVKQSTAFKSLVERINQTVDALKNPVWASLTDPHEVLKEYLYVMREAALIKGMSNTELAKAKFGVDPLNVRLWKTWSKAMSALTKAPSNETKEEVKFLQSSILLPLVLPISKLVTKLPMRAVRFFVPKRVPLMGSPLVPRFLYPTVKAVSVISSVSYYVTEWIMVIIGLGLIPVCILVIYYPDFMTVCLVPILTTFLTFQQVTASLSFLGIHWVPEVTWTQWLFEGTVSWLVWTVNVPLSMMAAVTSTLIWWNTLAINTIKSVFGLFGLWAFLKVASIIKLIYANTISTIAMTGMSGFIPSFLVFVSQAIIHGFVDPIHTLAGNFTLSALVLYVIPDPAGLWNLFISINLIPWTFVRELLVSPSTSSILQYGLAGMIWVWNHSLGDIANLFALAPGNFVTNLSITQAPVDILTHIFGPLDQRLGQIISSISSLRSIWR